MAFRIVRESDGNPARSRFRIVEQETGCEVEWVNRFSIASAFAGSLRSRCWITCAFNPASTDQCRDALSISASLLLIVRCVPCSPRRRTRSHRDFRSPIGATFPWALAVRCRH